MPRPSLVRRLTLGFVIGHIAAALLAMLTLFPLALIEDDEPTGPELIHLMLAQDLELNSRGGLVVRSGGELQDLLNRHPTAWFVALVDKRKLEHGSVPQDALRPLLYIPGLRDARLKNFGVAGPPGEALIDTVDTSAGVALVAAGGIVSDEISFADFFNYIQASYFFIMPLITGFITLAGALLAIPIVLRSLRPTTRAATELDPADLTRRLPESGVVKQLLPLVRAFNAALDRVAEAFERRRRFIADVAHELRTPLAVLNMHVEALPPGGVKPDLERTVFRLSHMVGQMLDAERMTLASRAHEQVALVELTRSVVADIAPLAIANGYDISVVAEGHETSVKGDPHAIGRTLSNLLGNAIAHGGGNGSIEVRISHGCIEVADEGPGIPPEARERIFEPFRRERWDRDGCGLGLHLVREVMRAHGGEASVTSNGTGAVFRLQFAKCA
ncbi:MAG TPA: HAMP domain-containing sensor histidine kinase [Sphingomonadaceae bacterium]|jgi:signal transduction histidine kinase|nr:HAMP domain-containing sensor histidine kinase [Sphingomonadaceae bacterium]